MLWIIMLPRIFLYTMKLALNLPNHPPSLSIFLFVTSINTYIFIKLNFRTVLYSNEAYVKYGDKKPTNNTCRKYKLNVYVKCWLFLSIYNCKNDWYLFYNSYLLCPLSLKSKQNSLRRLHLLIKKQPFWTLFLPCLKRISLNVAIW